MEWLGELFARTELLVGAAAAALFLGLAGIIALYKPYVIPIKTHAEQLEAERERATKAENDASEDARQAQANAAAEIAALRAEIAERMANIRADHAVRMEQAERFFNVALAEAKRYAEDWKASAHIESENRKALEDQLTEILETMRLLQSVVVALQRAAGVPQLPPGS